MALYETARQAVLKLLVVKENKNSKREAQINVPLSMCLFINYKITFLKFFCLVQFYSGHCYFL